MASPAIELAEALATLLSEQEFSMDFEATWDFVPVTDLQELKELRVTVVPGAQTSANLTRNNWDHRVAISVAFQKVARTKPERIALCDLVDEVGEYLRRNRLEGEEPLKARPTEVQQSPLFDPDALDEEGLFISVLEVFYAVWR